MAIHKITPTDIISVLVQQLDFQSPVRNLVFAVIEQALDDVALIDANFGFDSIENPGKKIASMNKYYTGVEAKRYLYGKPLEKLLIELGIEISFAHSLFVQLGNEKEIAKMFA